MHALGNLFLDAGLCQCLGTGDKWLAILPLTADLGDHVHSDLGDLSLFVGLEHRGRRGTSVLRAAGIRAGYLLSARRQGSQHGVGRGLYGNTLQGAATAGIRRQYQRLHADRRIAASGLVDDFLELVVGDDVQAVHDIHAGLAAIGQAQAPADGLLDQRAGIGGAQRNDGVEVGDVPTLFQHVDVDHDLGRLVIAFHRQQTPDHFLFLGTGTA